jgi:hypothetical protein
VAKANGTTQGRDVSRLPQDRPHQDRQPQQQERQRPAHEIRLGRIKAAIWANSTDQGVRYSVSLTRLYKDQGSGEWRTSSSFGRDDLLLVAQVCQMALVWVFQETQETADVPF